MSNRFRFIWSTSRKWWLTLKTIIRIYYTAVFVTQHYFNKWLINSLFNDENWISRESKNLSLVSDFGNFIQYDPNMMKLQLSGIPINGNFSFGVPSYSVHAVLIDVVFWSFIISANIKVEVFVNFWVRNRTHRHRKNRDYVLLREEEYSSVQRLSHLGNWSETTILKVIWASFEIIFEKT